LPSLTLRHGCSSSVVTLAAPLPLLYSPIPLQVPLPSVSHTALLPAAADAREPSPPLSAWNSLSSRLAGGSSGGSGASAPFRLSARFSLRDASSLVTECVQAAMQAGHTGGATDLAVALSHLQASGLLRSSSSSSDAGSAASLVREVVRLCRAEAGCDEASFGGLWAGASASSRVAGGGAAGAASAAAGAQLGRHRDMLMRALQPLLSQHLPLGAGASTCSRAGSSAGSAGSRSAGSSSDSSTIIVLPQLALFAAQQPGVDAGSGNPVLPWLPGSQAAVAATRGSAQAPASDADRPSLAQSALAFLPSTSLQAAGRRRGLQRCLLPVTSVSPQARGLLRPSACSGCSTGLAFPATALQVAPEPPASALLCGASSAGAVAPSLSSSSSGNSKHARGSRAASGGSGRGASGGLGSAGASAPLSGSLPTTSAQYVGFPVAYAVPLASGLDWGELLWGPYGVTIRGVYYPLQGMAWRPNTHIIRPHPATGLAPLAAPILGAALSSASSASAAVAGGAAGAGSRAGSSSASAAPAGGAGVAAGAGAKRKASSRPVACSSAAMDVA
jgi:hypothetical protein